MSNLKDSYEQLSEENKAGFWTLIERSLYWRGHKGLGETTIQSHMTAIAGIFREKLGDEIGVYT